MAKAYAYLNHGRWVVECPRDGCANAYLARTAPKRCECVSVEVCTHSEQCDQIIDVVTPDNRRAIELAVSTRPYANRNWRPGETVELLEAENIEHGVAVP